MPGQVAAGLVAAAVSAIAGAAAAVAARWPLLGEVPVWPGGVARAAVTTAHTGTGQSEPRRNGPQ